MTYTEKFTWSGKELIVKRQISPVQVVSAESKQIKLEKINVNDPSLRPSNYAKAEGTPLPILQADGVRLDLSTKEPMNFWHRNGRRRGDLLLQGEHPLGDGVGQITLQSGEMFAGIAHRSLRKTPRRKT